ncbi:MAG: hypothetical protein JST51_01905 [Armatimonadetes bacterium]|nr:hypothetical protein [Armatimonadota bacterium]
MKFRLLVWGLVVASSCAFGQKTTLDAYISKHKADLFKGGPGVYLEGERLKVESASIAAFHRKVVEIGDLTAIVPTTMIQIDDSFSKQPDLYDGMDMRSKIIYLLSTLTPGQIDQITSRGIGFGDLNRDQQLVFESLLPKKFEVERREVLGNDFKTTDKFTLNDEQRKQVRLRITRTVSFDFSLKDGKGTVQPDSMDNVGLHQVAGFYRQLSDMQSGPGSIFGINVRTEVPNKQKPSDLNYSAKSLDSLVGFSAPVTVQDALASIGQVVHLTIYSDPRVAKRSMTMVGGKARAGDLLAAIAQMVTGTYRRVGSLYVLTSDLMGLGTRKARFDQWEAELRDYQYKMSDEWGAAVGKSSLLKAAKSSPRDPYQPTKEMEEYLAKGEGAIPPSLVDDGLRSMVAKFNEEYTVQPVKVDGARAHNALSYHFALPSGEDVFEEAGGSIGQFRTFVFGGQRRQGPAAPTPPWTIAKGINVSCIVRTDEPEQIRGLVAKAKAIGMSELWVDTLDSGTLTAAVDASTKTGLKVKYVVRPWRSVTSSDDLDRTVIGTTGEEAGKWALTSKRLNRLREPSEITRSVLAWENGVSPDQTPDNWSLMGRIAKTPGLAGVVVCDEQPIGYEAKLGEGYSIGNSPSELVGRRLGYSLSMRSAFLRMTGVDPIDLVPDGLMSSVNVSPYFFPDMELMGYPRTYGRIDGDEYIIHPYVAQWDDFRAKEMADGLKRLRTKVLAGISVPVWSDLLPGLSNKVEGKIVPLCPMTEDTPFTFDGGGAGKPFGVNLANIAGARFVIDSLSGDEVKWQLNLAIDGLSKSPKPITCCLDLSRLSSSDVEKFLGSWFAPVKN